MTVNPGTRDQSARKSSRKLVWAVALPALLAAVGAGGWFVWSSSPPPPEATRQIVLQPVVAPPRAEAAVVPAAIAPPVSPPEPPAFDIETASEEHILKHVPTGTTDDLSVFRFVANPRILVLDFKSLRDQGRMLNRTAALVEKTGVPHDRLLNDAELDAAVRAGGDTPETFYYGHDYGAASVSRFFALADRDNVHLLHDEETLQRLIRQEGWFEPDTHAALISIPQAGADENVTLAARATILHHELSHGEYFTNPAYAAFVHRFWAQTLNAGERDRIRRHLHTLGYDAALDDLMENEAQAYLMFTDGAKFFTPDMFGMSKGRVTELRTEFFRSMPGGWLRDSLGQTLNADKPAASARP